MNILYNKPNNLPYYNTNFNKVKFCSSSVKMVKDIKLANLYGTSILGKVKLSDGFADVSHASNEFFSLRKDNKTLGYIAMSPRMYNGKTCYSAGELRNESDYKVLVQDLCRLV